MLPKNENVFLDTNVIIGYIFCLDHLNPHSKDIFNYNNTFYYSYHVKKEIKMVYRRKRMEFVKFFSLLRSILKRFRSTDFLSLSDFQLYIKKSGSINKLDVDEMEYALNYIWKSLDFGENQEVGEITYRLNHFQAKFNKKHSDNKDDFIKTAFYITSHRHKEKEILDLIKLKSLTEKLHGEDKNILFDLHEYNKNNPILNVILVSWDRKFMEAVEILIDKLSFDNYLCLKDVD